ncbi:MAG: hypothetical protein O2954_16160 [bacterium]|nr:hypothetical protein [bacterium]
MQSFFSKYPQAAGLVFSALILWFSGCSQADLPTASSGPSATPDAVRTNPRIAAGPSQHIPGGFGISLVPPHLAKRAEQRTFESTEQRVSARRGGFLAVASGQTFSWFHVPPRALEETTTIQMTLVGEGPYAQIHFGPEGLQFLRACTLSITFPSEGIDPETLGGYLIEENGESVPVEHKVRVHGRWITVTMAIHHFSIYSPGDGDDDTTPPEGETGGG